MKNLIALSGKIGSGKDEVFRMMNGISGGKYENKKFAYKLKLITSILIGCNVDQLENREFKEAYLPPHWNVYYRVFTEDPGMKMGSIYASQEELEDFYENFPIELDDSMNTCEKLTARRILQLLGTEGCREVIHPNVWVNALFADYQPESNWIITDCRFPNEADAVKERGGVVIRIERHGRKQGGHASETALDNYTGFDHVIHNDGSLGDLYDKVHDLWKSL